MSNPSNLSRNEIEHTAHRVRWITTRGSFFGGGFMSRRMDLCSWCKCSRIHDHLNRSLPVSRSQHFRMDGKINLSAKASTIGLRFWHHFFPLVISLLFLSSFNTLANIPQTHTFAATYNTRDTHFRFLVAVVVVVSSHTFIHTTFHGTAYFLNFTFITLLCIWYFCTLYAPTELEKSWISLATWTRTHNDTHLATWPCVVPICKIRETYPMTYTSALHCTGT